MDKFKLINVVAFFLLLSFTGCDVDSYIDRRNSGKYISLTPAITEILFALDLKENIAGVTDYCTYPPAASEKPSVGSIMSPSMEKITEINPQIIFAGKLTPPKILSALTKNGFNIEFIRADSVSQLKKDIIRIGVLTGKEKESRILTKKIGNELEDLTKSLKGAGRIKTFIEISHKPLMTAGGESYLNEVISLAGGVNVASDIQDDYLTVGYEFIIKRKPEVIVLLAGLSSGDKKRMTNILSTTPAVKNNRVYAISESERDIYLRPGPRLAEAVKKMAVMLHPEVSEDE
ncbi:MAG: helical backbone metal receptor [Elusimicrobia bacterium]|jgi:iron complex transport system substrate-binding protein|nr:helical backbone metal receptor [Elusimicrobiota bacterium]